MGDNMGLFEGEITDDHISAINYLNYLRRWDLNGVNDINDFTIKFAPALDQVIVKELGKAGVEQGRTERYPQIGSMLSSVDLYSAGGVRNEQHPMSLLSGLRTHVNEKFGIDLSDKEIQAVLYNEHAKDMNILATQMDKKSTVKKLFEMPIDLAITAGYHLTNNVGINTLPRVAQDVAVPLMIFGAGGALAQATGGAIYSMVFNDVASGFGAVASSYLSSAAGIAGSMKTQGLIDDIYDTVAYGDAKRALGWESGVSNQPIDWDLVFIGAGLHTYPVVMNTKIKQSASVKKMREGLTFFRRAMKEKGASSSVFKNTTKIYNSLLKTFGDFFGD